VGGGVVHVVKRALRALAGAIDESVADGAAEVSLAVVVVHVLVAEAREFVGEDAEDDAVGVVGGLSAAMVQYGGGVLTEPVDGLRGGIVIGGGAGRRRRIARPAESGLRRAPDHAAAGGRLALGGFVIAVRHAGTGQRSASLICRWSCASSVRPWRRLRMAMRR
jgi:hypothetical protein